LGEKVPKADEGAVPRSLTLIGNSMGAWISILYALRHPERVAQLVLEAGGGLNRPLAVPLLATNREDAMTILRAVHGPDAILPEWAVDALLGRATGSPLLRLTAVAENMVDARLGELRVPTTIVWGEHDGVVTRPYVDALLGGIPGASLHVVEGAAHIPHAQQPERFLACLPAIS
jgi:pimeloyl-ACP methyl ester carboxylesterase